MPDWSSYLATAQGTFFFITCVWPLLHIRSFEAVTGPKADKWLVKTVGILVSVVGAVLILEGLNRRITPEVVLLAVGCSLGLADIDVWYVARRVISRIYLLDVPAELTLVGLWTAARPSR